MTASNGYVLGSGSPGPAGQLLVSGGTGQPALFSGGAGIANSALAADGSGGLRWEPQNQRAAVKGLYSGASVPSGPQTTGDGVLLVAGDRALFIGTNPVDSGIYDVNAGAWTRTIDYAAGMSACCSYFWVQAGSTYASTMWECSSAPGSDVVGTDSLRFGLVAATEFVSAAQTGTGVAQAIPHGLGRTPLNVLVSVVDNSAVAGGLFTVTINSTDSTNVTVTGTVSVKYYVYAR